MEQNQPTMGAFEAGDIILSPSEPVKKSPRRKIWLLVLVIAVLILGGAGYLIYQNFSNNAAEKNGKSSESKIQESFNEYANYLLYGDEDSSEKVDMKAYMEDYNLYDPDVFAETANVEELEKINDLYKKFVDNYGKSTLSEAQVYFYYYLGCEDDLVDSAGCLVNLGEQYKKLYEDNMIVKVIDLRSRAMNAIANTYYDIYKIDTTVKSRAAE